MMLRGQGRAKKISRIPRMEVIANARLPLRRPRNEDQTVIRPWAVSTLTNRRHIPGIAGYRQVKIHLVTNFHVFQHVGLGGKAHFHRRPIDGGNGLVIERDFSNR